MSGHKAQKGRWCGRLIRRPRCGLRARGRLLRDAEVWAAPAEARTPLGHLSLRATAWDRNYHCPCFMAEELEAQRIWRTCPKFQPHPFCGCREYWQGSLSHIPVHSKNSHNLKVENFIWQKFLGLKSRRQHLKESWKSCPAELREGARSFRSFETKGR